MDYKKIPIREQPPTKTELERMLRIYDGNMRKLFNTSGGDYRAMNLKDKFPTMTTADTIDLLTANGNLVKRPFVLAKSGGIVGFNDEDWVRLFL